MWMMFPDGVTEVSVEQMNFVAEVHDEEKHGYFRAPDHLVPSLIDLTKCVVRVPPVDHPDDLPPTALTTATSDLAIANENLRNENSDLRGSIAELNVRVSDLMLQLHEAKTELHNFKFEQEQKGEGTAEAPFEAPMIGVETSSRKKG
jgi:hypothetical protein